MQFCRVDEWQRENPLDGYFFTEGNDIKLNLEKALPKSYSRIANRDSKFKDTLVTFSFDKRLFIHKTDLICRYNDYFVEFYDDDKELPTAYMYLKNQIDSVDRALTITEFLTIVNRRFFRDTNIKQNIYRMVDDNYNIDVTVDAVSGRIFDGPFDFTNDEAKQLLAVSIFMKMIIPLASQYTLTTKLYTDDELKNILTDVFVEVLYKVGTRFNDDDEDDVDLMLKKLYKFTSDNISRHHNVHNPLWVQQAALRGVTEHSHTDTILIKHLLGNNMFKFNFSDNIMSFLKSVVETQLRCTINKIRYKVTPTMVDTVKDFNGLSEIDKLEQSMVKIDESQIIRCAKSLPDAIERFIRQVGPITDEEIEYYLNNFDCTSVFHDMLIKNYFASTFGGFTELKSKSLEQYIQLLIIAKRLCEMNGTTQIQYLLSSVIKGRTSARLLQSANDINKLEADETYKKLVTEKYSTLMSYNKNRIREILSFVLNNVFTYVEYKDQELLGQEIVFDRDIIGKELLEFIDNI